MNSGIGDKRRWVAGVMAAAIGLAVVAGCAEMNGPQKGMKGAGILPDAPAMGTEPMSKGVYLAIDRRLPLQGEEVAKAELLRDAAVKAIREKILSEDKSAGQAGDGDGNQTANGAGNASVDKDGSAGRSVDGEPPPLAVKYYLQGREHFLEGANSQAMDALEQALELDPKAFTVLRLMGRVAFASSQLARGATYLERAHALEPKDVEVNYLLGRYCLERNDNERAAYYLAQAEDSPEQQITSTQTPLSAFYLGIAFQQAGYHLAAAREFGHFLELAALPVPGYRYDSELSYLISVEWTAHLSAAENFARADDYREALPHYVAAAAEQPGDAFVISRLVNAQVHEKQAEAGRKTALAFLTATGGSEDSIKLLSWTYQMAGREAMLVPELTGYLKGAGGANNGADGEQATLILASAQRYLGKKAEAFATLNAFAAKNPRDMAVLGRMMDQTESPQEFQAVAAAAAASIHADGDMEGEVVKRFDPLAKGAAGAGFMKAVLGKADFVKAPALAEGYFLEALAGEAHDAPETWTEATLNLAVKGAPDFFAARAELVNYFLAREKFAAASALVDQAIAVNVGGGDAWLLKVKCEAAQERLVQALALAREGAEKYPDDVNQRMEIAEIYRLRGQDSEADAVLQGITNDLPKFEPAYAALINSFFERQRRGEDVAPALPTMINALGKLMREIPSSRFGQITEAVLYASDGRLEEAENMLRTLLSAEPDDPEALIQLAQVRQLLGKIADADAVLEEAIARKADPDVVQTLAELYRRQERQADAVALVRKMMAENPDSDHFAVVCGNEMLAEKRAGDAVNVLGDAVKRLPHSEGVAMALAKAKVEAKDFSGAVKTMQDFIKGNGETTERLYQLSYFTTRAGMDDATVAALERVLAIMPDNIAANNDLGFFWADEGIRLEEAEPMIRKAVDNGPTDPAFLDSLGWVFYKQGKFEQARAELETAVGLPNGAQAEIVQHLGDTLYRLGRAAEAMNDWRQARQELQGVDDLDRDDRRLLDYLTKVMDDSLAGRMPTVSPLALPEKAKAAGPANAAGNGSVNGAH